MVDALPEVEILSRAMRLACLVVLNSLDARLIGSPQLRGGAYGADRRNVVRSDNRSTAAEEEDSVADQRTFVQCGRQSSSIWGLMSTASSSSMSMSDMALLCGNGGTLEKRLWMRRRGEGAEREGNWQSPLLLVGHPLHVRMIMLTVRPGITSSSPLV